MATFNDSGELILTKEEAMALAILLSNGVESHSLGEIGLADLEEMLYRRFDDMPEYQDATTWDHIACKVEHDD